VAGIDRVSGRRTERLCAYGSGTVTRVRVPAVMTKARALFPAAAASRAWPG